MGKPKAYNFSILPIPFKKDLLSQKIYTSVYGKNKKSIPLKLKSWYKVDIWHNLSHGKVKLLTHFPKIFLIAFAIKVNINVDVNGVTMSSKEIAIVDRTTHLYTSSMLGHPPAMGVIKDVTVINSNEAFFGN